MNTLESHLHVSCRNQSFLDQVLRYLFIGTSRQKSPDGHTASSDLLRNPRLKPMPAWILNLMRNHNECESTLINEMIM